jgi:glycosyltransferase involved in cell wall biosynthesis
MVVQVRKIIADIRPDVLHAHSVEDVALLGALSGFHPFVVTPWGSDVLVAPKESAIARWKVKYSLRKADLITCDAEHIKKPLVELQAAPEKINLIYFGVDVDKFKPGPKDLKIMKELDADGRPVVITSRRLDPNCDIASLVTAASAVLKDVPETIFIIIGRGAEEDNLKAQAEALGVSGNIRFIGWVPHDDLPRYLSSAHIYVSTALSDAGIAASTAEAMSCGLPAIITDFGDNGKWVEDGINGFLIPLQSPEVLASRILQLLKNGEERETFGKRNREIIEDRNNWPKEMGKMEKLYESLVASDEKKAR